MKSKLFFLLSLFIWSTGQGQDILKAYLFDKAGRQPVPFATIKVLHKPFGTFSDSIGNFKVEASTSDTILITSIGFVTLKTTGFPRDTIYLEPISKELSPVILVQKKPVSTSILGIDSKADFRWGLIPGDEFAQKIYLSLNTKEYCKINKVIISMERFSNETPLLLHIYSVDTLSQKPSSELLSRNYFFSRGDFKKGKIIIDLGSENIFVEENNIFISLQWLVPKDSKIARPFLKMTNKVTDRLTYSRTLAASTYDWFLSPILYGKTTNTIFQVEIDKFIK